jgi:beta-lactamase class A
MPRPGRATARAAARAAASAVAVVAAAAALVIFLGRRGHGGAAVAAAPPVPARAASGGSTAPAAVPGSAARHANPLSGAASAAVAGRSGRVLAAVYDVGTGQSWHLGDGPAQAEASVVKLNILEALLAGHGGAGLPAADLPLARSMIEDSDNDAATSLWDAAGGTAGIGAYDASAGLSRTTPSACVTCAGFAWPGWGLTATVPGDQLTLLRQLIAPGPRPLLSAAARSYALSLMEHVTPDQRWGISSGVPSGVTVALKNGWLPLNGADTDWQVNSVGWVHGQGRNYLIAVFTTGNPTERYGINTVSALSAAVWSAMARGR